jgi:hypothetical protein
MSQVPLRSVLIGLFFWGAGLCVLFLAQPSSDQPEPVVTALSHSLKTLGVSILLMAAGALFLARPVINLILQPFMNMLFPEESYVPPPIYTLPEMYLRQDRPAEAAAEYEKMIRNHPGEVNAHIFLIEVALTRLNDPHRAEKAHKHGLHKIKDEADRKLMTDWYEALKQGAPGQLPAAGAPPPPGAEG